METFDVIRGKVREFEQTCSSAELDPLNHQLILDQLQKLKANEQIYKQLVEQADMDTHNSCFKSWTEADVAIQKQRKDLAARRHRMTALQEEVHSAQDCLLNNKSDGILMQLETFFTDKQPATVKMDLPTRVSELHKTLGGVELQASTEDSDVLLITFGTSEPTVRAELHYTKQKPPYPDKLSEVKMGYCPISVEDLISRALVNNSFASVIPDIQERLENSAGLSKEIEELRTMSAVDWIPNERCMKLMVGPHTCTLRVPQGYPTSGRVELEGVNEGLLGSLQPPGENPTLSDWVNHIERHLGS